MSTTHPTHSGYMTLLGVLLVGAVVIGTTMSILLSGVDATKNITSYQQGTQALFAAHSCAEDALGQIRMNPLFAGTGGRTFTTSLSCSYTVIHTAVESRTIESTATQGTIVRKVKVMLNDLNPQISIVSWQEVSAF